METRSRKRAEAIRQRPLPSSSRANKRPRFSSSSSSSSPSISTSILTPPRQRIATRTISASFRASELIMDPGQDLMKKDKEEKEQEQGPARTIRHVEKEIERGKEKEIEREKRHDRDRSGNGGGGEESILHPNLASASSALHGLLRKLGAGLDDLLPSSSPSSHQNSRLKRILSGLRAEGEETRQVEALNQLCELLSIGTEDSLSSFSVDSFVPVLVGLLNHEYNPDMMLLAARALTHLCDVLPSSCAAVVHYGAVPCLCARLLTIEYIDLAEQSLQALDKISHEHPTACLKAGALIAVLSYLDFFPTGVQRVAVATAANMCRQLPSDASDFFIMDAIPILTNLLQYQDSKVVEHASVCLTRIAESFVSSPERLDVLCSNGLIPHVARLVSVSNPVGTQASLSNSTYTGLIRLLSTCIGGSAAAAETILSLNISGTLREILAGSGLISSVSVSPLAVNRPPEQLYEIVNLVNKLLPPIPQASGLANGALSKNISRKDVAGVSERLEDGSLQIPDVSAREKFLYDHPELLAQFGRDLLPVLVQVYGSSVSPLVRHKCLAAISKLIYFSSADMLGTLLKDLNISSFLAGVLASKDPSFLVTALQVAEMLMQKLPDMFKKLFLKEGVVHAIDNIAASDQVAGAGVVDSSSVISTSTPLSRSRRSGAGKRYSASNGERGQQDPKDPSGVPANSPPNSGPESTNHVLKTGLLSLVSSMAKHLKETYFLADTSTADASLTHSICKLKVLCSKLNGDGITENKVRCKGKGKALGSTLSSSADDEQMLAAISEILTELSRDDGVSTFEFVGSGVVPALLNFFSCAGQLKENMTDTNLERNLQDQVLKRFKQFIGLLLPSLPSQNMDSRLTMLVQKLQDALASLERFPVILSHSPRSGSGSGGLAASLTALAQPFKLRLCRASGEKCLRDFSSNIVLIDPLASLSSIEEFLWPRVQRADGSHTKAFNTVDGGVTGADPMETSPLTTTEHRPSTRSHSSAVIKDSDLGISATTSKGKGKVGARTTTDEYKGPETRNAAARRRDEAANVLKQYHGDSGLLHGNEDDDFDISPVELEAVVMGDDISEDEDEEEHEARLVFDEDTVPACLSERVLDVRLVDNAIEATAASTSVNSDEVAAKPSNLRSAVGLHGGRSVVKGGSEGGELRMRTSPGLKNSLSFAAAAMAGLASGSGKGLRVGRERRSLTSIAASTGPARLVFTLGGKSLNRSLTVFQAIQRQAIADDDDEERYTGLDFSVSGEGRRLWDDVYAIYYERAESAPEKLLAATSSNNSCESAISVQNKGDSTSSTRSRSGRQQASLVESVLQRELPCDLDKSNPTYDILLLLRILEGLNRLAPRLYAQIISDSFAEGKMDSEHGIQITRPLIHQVEFLSSKLTPKLARQLQDALTLCSGGLPTWCHQLTRACPFLFPFEARRRYFQSTGFGVSRALQRLQQQQSADNSANLNERELRVGRLQRQKVRVSRNRILDSAAKVMELYAGHKAVLEVEYFGEVGTGLGPTLEFYTLLSHDLQKSSLEMWRTGSTAGSNPVTVDEDAEMHELDLESNESSSDATRNVAKFDSYPENEDYVQAPYGLFPRPWLQILDLCSDTRHSKVVEYFRLLGRTMGKCLQDGRLLDLPLSVAFYKLMLGQELDIYDIKSFDAELGTTLEEMQNLVHRKKFLESVRAHDKYNISELRFRGIKIEDLCIDFTLPGYPDYVLKPGGHNIMVDITNLEEYLSLVVNATVKTGISTQMEAFRAGFNQVIQIGSLQIFTEEELDYLICGRQEMWVAETLAEHIKFDHGYTASSPPVRNLLEILGEFSVEKQRAFLRFVTGAPRLPPGGLAALHPKLTIVRKHPTGTSGGASVLGSTPPGGASTMGTTLADGDLPSVMTCANYLKLPPYSCKEIMRERLLYAISEGQGSFDLS